MQLIVHNTHDIFQLLSQSVPVYNVHMRSVYWDDREVAYAALFITCALLEHSDPDPSGTQDNLGIASCP